MDTPPSPVAAPRRTRRQWTPKSHADHHIGRSVDDGRFVIRSLIAQGGMADVFLADDRRDGRPVAIKILRADDVDSDEGRRFVREVRVLANLQHPNLVAVLATGTTDEGNPYMVQPYLGGDTLRARLAGGPLGWRVALEIGVQIADVLQCLHEAGIVHRDVKIDNIIWARHPTQPVWVKLIDLGIAKLLGWVPPPIEAALPLDQRVTRIGCVLGTDGYRPPEALEGICTPRFDVFSLGVTLYRLCANTMPESEVRPLADVCPGWDGPADFETAIRKALDPDPERRFASAETLRLTLEAIRTCNPEPDRPRYLFAGRFDLLRPLGSGAKATTYAAYDRELEATAAIKILSARSQADPDECLRFIREAMILRHVRHPNLPAFFELGTHAGQRYLAMELCPGKRAREYTLSTTCLRPAEVIRIGEQLASALKALGEAGVIYRDLTHDNVLIHFDDRDPKVKLIDFNASLLIEDRFYARLDERWARPPEQRVRPSRELGLKTMTYAAPEVRAGATWSERSDVFALGRLLYLLLTGQEPFSCGEPKGPLTPPWRKDCPENLINVLETALEIDPDRRATIDTVIEYLTLAREEIELEEKAARDAPRTERDAEPEPAAVGAPAVGSPVIWHPPRLAPDPDLIPFEIPEDGLAYNYSGETLDGRYQLDKPFGPGGTSTVYSGKDLRTGAQVAVKILNACMHEHLLGLFGQEGRVAARHTCPHLVQAIDFGKHEDCAFTVFKFVDGISLFNLGRDNPLPWRRVARLAIQILAALHALHTSGIVHCDLHPSNVLVRPDLEGQEFAVVIDVGFAFVIPPKRITGAPEPSKYIFGMYRYIAPERRAGDAPGPSSDLYSLGVLLWELLTAQTLPAYEIDPGLAIPPVRTIAPGLDIPEALDAIIMHALSDVEHRFRDALQMAQALRDVLEGAAPPVLTAPALPAASAAALAIAPVPASTTSPELPPHASPSAPAAAGASFSAPTLAATSTTLTTEPEPEPVAEPVPVTELGHELSERSEIDKAESELEVAVREPSLIAEVRDPAVVPQPATWRSWRLLGMLGVLSAGVVVVARSLLPGGPAADSQAADVQPQYEPVAERSQVTPVPGVTAAERPPAAPDPMIDMEATLARVDDSLQTCARAAGRRITIDLAVEANGTRFASIVIMPAEAAVDRCVRKILEPVRFLSHASATTFIKRYQP